MDKKGIGRFDYSLKTLRRALAKAKIDDPCPVCDLEAAIRLLEEAGKVNKRRAIDRINSSFAFEASHFPVTPDPDVMAAMALLEALPEDKA